MTFTQYPVVFFRPFHLRGRACPPGRLALRQTQRGATQHNATILLDVIISIKITFQLTFHLIRQPKVGKNPWLR